jgi:PTS system mannose-specific IID component
VVWDPAAGTVAGVAITMAGGLPLEQSLTVAVPISLLFAQIHTVRRIWFAYPAAKADQAAEKGNDRAIIFYGSWFCWLSRAVLYGIPMTLAMMFGAQAIGNLMANLPPWVINTLSALGGILPALGFAMTVRVIGRPIFLPFFLGGFFLVQYTSVGGLFLAMIGLFFAFIYYLILDATKGEQAGGNEQHAGSAAIDENTQRHLTIRDCDRMFRRWFWFCEQSNSFSRLQSVAFCCAFIPAMKKLYGNDEKEYSAALTRHLMFFNTQGIWGSVIHGIVLAMEEQRAIGAPIDAAAITGIKSGLMGPFAGIGDTIDWSTLFPLFTILVLPLAAAGSIMGPLLQLILMSVTLFTEGTIFSRTGFRLGTRAAVNVLSGHGINMFISVASVLGLFMMGGLSASMVKVFTPIYIPTTGTPVIIQTDVLNKVAPGILSLITVLGTYRYLQTGHTMTRATLWLLMIGLILGAIGIIGNGGLIFHAYVKPAVK